MTFPVAHSGTSCLHSRQVAATHKMATDVTHTHQAYHSNILSQQGAESGPSPFAPLDG